MKPFTRNKTINGHQYKYEITTYYDPKTKTIKQKSHYLGKTQNNQTTKHQLPKNIYNHGELIPLQNITKQLQIEQTLNKHLPKEKTQTLLTLSYNKILRPLPLYQTQTWYQTTDLKNQWNLNINSQRISDLLTEIGQSNIPNTFSTQLVKQTTPTKTLIYDLTSISSYAKSINILEYGYNREHNSTQQANFSLVVDKEKNLPILYDIYPGSIVDVSTLKNTIKKLDALNIKNYTLILDRGFFSLTNINELLQNNLNFIIPATFQHKDVKQLFSELHKDISDPKYLQKFEDKVLFVKAVSLSFGGHSLVGYGFYSPSKEQVEREVFYQNLFDVKVRLEGVVLKAWMSPSVVFREVAKGFACYFSWEVVGGRFVVGLRRDEVVLRVNRMGLFVLFCCGGFSWDECLCLYRGRDLVEKGFDFLKNDLALRPLNVHKEGSFRGLLFVGFLALVLKMRLLAQMRQSGLLERYTLGSLFLELEKIKKIELADGSFITMEQTRVQKDILDALKSCA
jgi:transposase